MTDVWPWLVLAGLGAFHGANPAAGWLFAVALGLHRQQRAIVFMSLLPIAAGHALSVAALAALLAFAGMLLPQSLLRAGLGLLLLGWAGYHAAYGHRRRVRVGMRTGLWGLAVWSFLAATAHGAGLMLWPALMPLCFPDGGATGGPLVPALVGVAVHTAAMLTVTALMATLVYEWLGLAGLRGAWVNVDALWVLALAATGAWLLLG